MSIASVWRKSKFIFSHRRCTDVPETLTEKDALILRAPVRKIGRGQTRRQRQESVRAENSLFNFSVVMRMRFSDLTPNRYEKKSARNDEFNVHSFIVKVWIIEDVNKDGHSTWYGHITRVPGGEQRYLRSLSEIENFIRPYLKAAGIRFRLIDRIRKRLSFRSGEVTKR